MTGKWMISRVEVSHSHPLNPKLSGIFSANRQLSMHQNDQAGIRSSKTYQALPNAAGGPANLTFTEKDVRNYISRHLRIFVDETDPKEYDMPFGSFVGVNYHGMSTLLG
ncbi:hypothetical protein Ahy_B01g055749 [Arachis hypogaea]|uniref:Protein FAR1-RELATED SEQUENCE n=1 Tax=Arachis hypogaea TaxID=3818 RepID=A0A445AWY7_ARAHY|nr:hypothetical protein Ahy_B01g055749 [Arachis hypogaea]